MKVENITIKRRQISFQTKNLLISITRGDG